MVTSFSKQIYGNKYCLQNLINIYLLSADTLKQVYDAANELKMYGEKYAWFAGTKEAGAEFDPSCCDDMAVLFHIFLNLYINCSLRLHSFPP